MATATIHLWLLNDSGLAISEFSQRKPPSFINIGEHGSARFTVGGVGILLTSHIDFFHQAPRGDIIFVNIDSLLAAFECDIVASGCIVALTFLDEALDFLDVGNMPRGESSPIGKTLRIHELRAEGFCWTVIWVVAIFEDDFHSRAGIRVTAFRDTLAREKNGGVAEATECLFANF